MPTYEYECPTCEDVTEVFHGMTQKPRVRCQVCGSRRRKLLGTGAGIIFKGGGFYETDYRSDSYRAGQKAASSSSSSSSSASKDAAKGADTAGGKKDTKSSKPASAKSGTTSSTSSSATTAAGSD